MPKSRFAILIVLLSVQFPAWGQDGPDQRSFKERVLCRLQLVLGRGKDVGEKLWTDRDSVAGAAKELGGGVWFQFGRFRQAILNVISPGEKAAPSAFPRLSPAERERWESLLPPPFANYTGERRAGLAAPPHIKYRSPAASPEGITIPPEETWTNPFMWYLPGNAWNCLFASTYGDQAKGIQKEIVDEGTLLPDPKAAAAQTALIQFQRSTGLDVTPLLSPESRAILNSEMARDAAVSNETNSSPAPSAAGDISRSVVVGTVAGVTAVTAAQMAKGDNADGDQAGGPGGAAAPSEIAPADLTGSGEGQAPATGGPDAGSPGNTGGEM